MKRGVNNTDVFRSKLAEYKHAIDTDITDYTEHIIKQAGNIYGESAQAVTQAYAEILNRSDERIQGTLTLVGYKMCGGSDHKLILQAARAIEMMHAYILVVNDIQDHSHNKDSQVARNILTAIKSDEDWTGDTGKAVRVLAMNAGLLGSHGAQLVLSNLAVENDLKLKALTIMNHTMMVRLHGQTQAIVDASSVRRISEAAALRTIQWKTAHYSVLNPIHMGMVLAGAGCEDTNAITEYALQTGIVLQSIDDRQREQSRTAANKLEKRAQNACRTAQQCLKKHANRWDDESVIFLDNLVTYFAQSATAPLQLNKLMGS